MRNLASGMGQSTVRIEARNPDGSEQVGTGFLVSKKGHVITNWHVVAFYSVDQTGLLQFEYSDPIIVHWNNLDYEARVVHRQNTDPPYTCDFAILQIDATDTPFLPLGEYEDVEQGDQVCFMGYPMGYDEAFFSTGHVACLRSVPSDYNRMIKLDVIELDASINLGNSGGPLVQQASGKVAGITTLRHGNISQELETIRGYLKRWPVRGGILESSLLELIDHAQKYTNIGLGTAISIGYAKDELLRLGAKIGS